MNPERRGMSMIEELREISARGRKYPKATVWGAGDVTYSAEAAIKCDDLDRLLALAEAAKAVVLGWPDPPFIVTVTDNEDTWGDLRTALAALDDQQDGEGK